MRKADIETRSHNRGYPPFYPTINVKVYSLGLSVDALTTKYGCDDDTAEQALTFAFESQQQQFWEQAEELARDIFGSHVKVYSSGRSSGWLIVRNLPDLESWDAVEVGKWSKFARLIAADIKWRTSAETLADDIEANEWCKVGAERYNFVDTSNGPTCIADLKAAAREAGFGPVIR
jgi:hypothetical protein